MSALGGGPFADIDPQDLQAIFEAMLEDVDITASRAKGKQRKENVADTQTDVPEHTEDPYTFQTMLQDRKLALSMSVAVLRDANILQESIAEEEQARDDRLLALRMGGFGESELPPQENTNAPGPQTGTKRKGRFPSDSPPAEVVAESSAQAAARAKKFDDEPRGNCVACDEEKRSSDLAQMTCGHEYCGACLDELFTLSMRDETLFPPRCDGEEIRLSDRVEELLSPAVSDQFKAKYEELSTKNRTYCHDPRCSTFIPPSFINTEIGVCPECSKTTCTMCKEISHSGDCPEDAAMKELVRTADNNQWQRCYQCNRVIELDTGCNHMTCHCGAQFCYICGQQWKRCRCVEFTEDLLYRRAAAIIDRDPHHRLFQPQRVAHIQPRRSHQASGDIAAASASRGTGRNAASTTGEDMVDIQSAETAALNERNARIAEIVEHLRENHECRHDTWQFVPGRHRCEECHDTLRGYIYECAQCHLQVCKRCRRNRL